MRLLDLIKQAGADAVHAGYPVSIFTGNVTQVNPLEVSFDPQREPLTEDFLLVPESLTPLQLDLKHTHSINGGKTEEALAEPIVIRKGLEAGDVVLLLRMQGGLKFIVLDKVVEG
ncbi:DUF2577 domain-containing protein [Paenibacillus sp. OAS669]|uniref:DUF2577 domain-containing protein n=1 Tax=Paenibacillus sp. OAS669 TaxID=2663821 RepID=UPI00178968A5|nr:DUF2577 domain-containing protein [Paenibacillus sp. OAS669]MBE1444187.1 hypothetical protein [Paenibacillus sp. OAS669]